LGNSRHRRTKGRNVFLLLIRRFVYLENQIDFSNFETGDRNVEIGSFDCHQVTKFDGQDLFIPTGVLGHLVVRNHSGQALSSLPNLCWNYDAFGNRLQQYGASLAFQSGSGGPYACQPQSGGTVSTAQASFDGNNRMTSTNAHGVTAQSLYRAVGNGT
jgi:hypothetical protein